MPIDIDLFRSLSVNEQNKLKDKIEAALDSTRNDLRVVETKLKAAMTDTSTSHNELQPLLSYRSEIKQVHDQLKADLDMIERFLQGSDRGANPVIVAAATFGQGTVGIRKDDTQNRKIAGAKTYQQILDERKKDEDAVALMELDAKLRKLEEFRKLENSKQQTQTQTTKML